LLEVGPAGQSIDAVFQAYDGRDWDFEGATCKVSVHGVHDDGCCKWVQLVIEGPVRKMLTLRLCSTPDPGSALVSKTNLPQ
jgi:hypothetical protein